VEAEVMERAGCSRTDRPTWRCNRNGSRPCPRRVVQGRSASPTCWSLPASVEPL